MMCPMKVKESTEILVDYCAQTLERVRVAEFEKHMETCGDCRRFVSEQGDLWETMDRWTPISISPDFDQRLYAKIAQEEAEPVWRQWWYRITRPAVPWMAWKPAVSLAAACAVLTLGLTVHIPGPSDTSSQIKPEKVDIEQVEKTLDDLDILMPLSQAPAS